MKSEKYVIVNNVAVKNSIPVGHKAIYVLMSNHRDGMSKPIYVGQTGNLRQRFLYHEKVLWHWNKFNRPVTAWIVGLVRSKNADEAEQDLITKFSAAGFHLFNRAINDPVARGIQTTQSVQDSKQAEILAFLEAESPTNTVYKDWQAKWLTAQADGTIDAQDDGTIIDRFFRTAEGTDIRQHPHYVPLPRETTSTELLLHQVNQHHSLLDDSGIKSPILMIVLQKLARAYDSRCGYVQISSADISKACGISEKAIDRHLTSITETGLWAKARIGKGSTMYFPLFIEGVAENYFILRYGHDYEF